LLPTGPQPVVRRSQEAWVVKWVALDELRRDQCFEDHYSIIQTMRRKLPR
jgi:hypothetical protein